MRKTREQRLQIRAMYKNRLTMPSCVQAMQGAPVLTTQRLGDDFHKRPTCKRGERVDWSWDWRKDLSIQALNRAKG